jgi:hypothetical protein
MHRQLEFDPFAPSQLTMNRRWKKMGYLCGGAFSLDPRASSIAASSAFFLRASRLGLDSAVFSRRWGLGAGTVVRGACVEPVL